MQAKNKQKIVNKNNNGGIYTKEFKAHIISTMKNTTIFVSIQEKLLYVTFKKTKICKFFYNLRINLRQKYGYSYICTLFVKPILYETWFIVVVNFTLFVEISRSASKIQIYLNVQ